MLVTVIVGMCGTGKTVLAKSMSKNVISIDEYRYTLDWKKKDFNLFRQQVFDKIDENDEDKIVEGSYFDVNDPEHAREKVFNEIIDKYKTKIIVIEPKSLHQAVTSIVSRSMRRYAGHESQNGDGNVETASNVAGLVLKQVNNYDKIISVYHDFYKKHPEANHRFIDFC